MGHDFHDYALEQKVIVIMRQTHLREAFQAICSSGDGRWDRRDGSIFFQWLIYNERICIKAFMQIICHA